MNRVCKAVLAAALSVGTMGPLGSEANAEILFVGIYTITAATPSCAGHIGVGNTANAQFHPAKAPGNSNFSALNRIWDFGAQSYALATGSFTTAYKKVTNRGIGWNVFTPPKPSFVLISKQVPPTITNSTSSIVLEGKIKNIYGQAGLETCEASFSMVGLKQVQ